MSRPPEDKESPKLKVRMKRFRRKPKRFEVEQTSLAKQSRIKYLTQKLKNWTDGSLCLLSQTLLSDIDCSTKEIASTIEKTPEEIDDLLDVITKARWEDDALQNALGDDMLLNKDTSGSGETPLDFWRYVCSSLTPPSLNNSSEIAAVMKDIANSSDEEFGPIYEYLAMALDDPISTYQTVPNLSPVQAGILLEIIHSLALAAKDHRHLQSYLCDRAVAAMAGDWESLKMPSETRDPSERRAQAKRVALQSLNPFAMSRSSLPPIVSKTIDGPSSSRSTSPPLSQTLTPSLRPLQAMTKLNTGFTTMSVPTEGKRAAPVGASETFPFKRLPPKKSQPPVDLDISSQQFVFHNEEEDDVDAN